MSAESTSTSAESTTNDPRDLAAKFAPVIALGATWVVRKGMTKGYEAGTGSPAPVIARRQASVTSRVLWSAAMGATVALIEILVWRLLERDRDE